MAALEEALHLASSKFKISELNTYQRLAIRKFVVEKEDVFVNLPTYTGSGKSLINQALPLVFNGRGFAFGSADVRGLSVEHMKN